MNETEGLIKLYENMAKIEAENSRRWHKQLILSNIIWAAVLVIVVVGLVVAHFVYESQFETVETQEEIRTIHQENDQGNNVYQPGEYATYNEGGE